MNRKQRIPKTLLTHSRLFLFCMLVFFGLFFGVFQAYASGEQIDKEQEQSATQGIPGRRLGDIVIEVLLEKEPQDDYWEWFISYVDKRSEQRRLVNENRIKLSMLAKEAKSRRSTWFKLLIQDQRFTEPDLEGGYWVDFFTAGGKTEFPRIVAIRQDLKDQRDKLASEIKKLRSKQEKLINEAINATKELHENTSARFAKSKEKHPELKGEVDLLDEEQRLLKIELYDAAEWYAPHQLTKLVKEYKARKGSLPEHLQFLHVRALIGEAEWLEEKVYLQRNSPNYQDQKAIRKKTKDNIEYYRQLLELTKSIYDVMHDAGLIKEHSGIDGKTQSPRSRGSKPSRGFTTDSVHPGDPIQVLARSARFDAMTILRDMHKRMPDKQDILQELLQQELFFIQRIADKINAEQHVSMMAFYGYLKERGFGQKELKDDPNVSLDPLFLEQLWAGLGMGPVAAFSALSVDDTFAGMPIPAWLFPDDWRVNTPDALAEIVGDAQQQSAQNRIAINALLRMMKNGLKLAQLPNLNPTTMAAYLVARDGSGRSLPPDRLNGLLRDIREMMTQLPELGALVHGDLISFSRAFGRGHYPSIHPEYTWYEWFGDIFNAKNIVLLWGPNSVYSLNGKVAISGLKASAPFRAGVTITAREKFVETVGLGKLSQWIANGPVGMTLAAQRGPALLINADKYLKASRIGAFYSLASSVGNTGANIANTLLLYGGTSVLAQQYNYGPGAQFLIEAVAEIGVADILADAMRAGGITPGRIAAAADEISDRASKQVRAVEIRNEIMERVKGAAARPAKNKVEAKKIQKVQQEAAEIFPPVKSESFPQDLPDASEYAGAHAANALKTGDLENATLAADATKKVNKVLKEQAAQLDKQAKSAKRLANQAEAGTPQKSTISRDELQYKFAPTVDERVMNADPYERFWAPKLHQDKVAGANLKAGDLAVRNDSLDTALDHYAEARRKLLERSKKISSSQEQEDMLYLLDQRIAMIMEYNDTYWARKAANEFAGELNLNHTAPISVDLANTVAAKVDDIAADISDTELKRLGSLQDQIKHSNRLRKQELRGISNQARRKEINAIYDARIARLKAQQHPGIEGVEFFRYNPEGSAIWTVEHEGRTFFVKLSLQGEAAKALELDNVASKLAHALDINTFSNKLNTGQRSKLLVSRGVDVGADFGDLNDGEILAFLDEYAEQTVFRAWLADPDGHYGNLIISKDGRLLPFDFDRAQLKTDKLNKLFPYAAYADEGKLMEGTVLFKHGQVIDTENPVLSKNLRAKMDNNRWKMYSSMARIQQMISYKRLKKTVDKIKDLANNERTLKDLLEKGGWPDVETAARVLRERANKLEETLKPLFDQKLIDGVPRIITSQVDRSPGDHGQLKKVALDKALPTSIHIQLKFGPTNKTYYLREAA